MRRPCRLILAWWRLLSSHTAMNTKTQLLAAHDIGPLIQSIRGQRVILDSDLSSIYGVQTKYLNRSVKRNLDSLPLRIRLPVNPRRRGFFKVPNWNLKVRAWPTPQVPPFRLY